MGLFPEGQAGPLLLGDASEDAIEETLEEFGWLTLLGEWVRPDKLKGISPKRVDRLTERADLVLVEADGARGRSLKLPAPYEPVLPKSTGHVVVLAGLDVLGAPLTEALVHRLPLVLEAARL